MEVDVVDSKDFRPGVAVAGDWTAIEPCTVIAAFDKQPPLLTPKRVVAKFSVNDPTLAADARLIASRDGLHPATGPSGTAARDGGPISKARRS